MFPVTLEPSLNYLQALSRLSAVTFSTNASELRAAGIYVEEALKCVAGTKSVQDIVGLDYDQLIRRLSMKWTPEQAFRTGWSFSVQISFAHYLFCSTINPDFQRQCQRRRSLTAPQDFSGADAY